MAFERLLAGLGFGGARVDTVLASEPVVPGGAVTGEVRLQGGSVTQHIEEVSLGLRARAAESRGEVEHEVELEFARACVAEGVDLGAGVQEVVPFELAVPWEAPFTRVAGRDVWGMSVGVNTRVHVAGGVDPGDFDPVSVQALDVQEAVAGALAELGCALERVGIQRGRVPDCGQGLPFYQEFVCGVGDRYEGLEQLGVVFVAGERSCSVALDVGRRGLLGEARSQLVRLDVAHDEVGVRDLVGELDGRIAAVAGGEGEG
ncbi:hypothetical protein GCM10027570_42160 [Streptomonospora sediminis]